MIVSRDGDFGANLGNKATINDWLAREFRERVSPQRQIILFTRLTDALKKLDEQVSAADVAAEDEIIKDEAAERLSDTLNPNSASLAELVRHVKEYRELQEWAKKQTKGDE
jgi:hypothetical protein